MTKIFTYLAISVFSICSTLLPVSILKAEASEEKPGAHDHDDHEHEEKKPAPGKKEAADSHGHDEKSHEHGEKDSHGHKEEGSAEEKDEHGHGEHEEKGHAHGEEGEEHEEGGGSAVGPDKGIVEANEANGFKLSPEAFKNFGVKTVAIQPGVAVTLPRKAIFFGLRERNLFRLRDGFFKRIDFTTISKSKTEFTLKTNDVRPGDQVVVEGVGFLRIAELAATGGVGEGHSH